MKWKQLLMALVLFLFSFGLRIYELDETPVYADEVTWMARAKDVYASVRSGRWNFFNAGWWLDTTTAEPIGLPMAFLGGVSMTFLSPGYSHYSLNIMRDFAAVRIPAAFLGAIFVPALYFLVKKFIGDKIALVASLLIAVDPVAVGLSRWLHQDMALMVFSTLGVLVFVYSGNFIATIISALFTSMAILTKPQGLIVPLSLVATYLIARVFKKHPDIKRLVVWLLITGVFTILLFPFLWEHALRGMWQYLLIQLGNANAGQLTMFDGKLTNTPAWNYYFKIFPFHLPEGVLIGFLVGMVLLLLKIKRKLSPGNFVWLILTYSLLFIATISWSNKKLGIRYIFGIWPYLYLVAAYGLVQVSEQLKISFRKFFWIIIASFSVWSALRFYPYYYLFHNHFISPDNYQSLESVGFCDGVKESIKYLEPKLFHGVKIMLPGCDSTINYYTGFTVNRVGNVAEDPDYIIEENIDAQKFPERVAEIHSAGYTEIKEINFRGLVLAKIYEK
jgi:hypothetical protein